MDEVTRCCWRVLQVPKRQPELCRGSPATSVSSGHEAWCGTSGRWAVTGIYKLQKSSARVLFYSEVSVRWDWAFGEPREGLRTATLSSWGLLGPCRGRSPGPAVVGKQQKPHPKLPECTSAEVWGLHTCVETMFWNPWNGQMCSSHLERGLWAVGESPRLVLSLLTAGQHRQATSTAHQLSDSDVLRSSNPSTGLLWSTISAGHASSCFFSVLGDAGTEPAQHRESGSPVSCLLLGWLLNSCFSYDITAFKLQKKSISELKTYRLFHKKERARC